MTVFHSKKFVRSACSRNLKAEGEKLSKREQIFSASHSHLVLSAGFIMFMESAA